LQAASPCLFSKPAAKSRSPTRGAGHSLTLGSTDVSCAIRPSRSTFSPSFLCGLDQVSDEYCNVRVGEVDWLRRVI
jgi:hypothetical protein